MKVVVENGNVSLNGNQGELIAGLVCYAFALLELNVEFEDIERAIRKAKQYREKIKNTENQVKTIYEDENITVKKAETNPGMMTKEEFKEMLSKMFE